MRAVIVGGGIGGLAAAAALRRGGNEAVVVERAPSIQTVGFGLSLAPNALAALDRLGVGDDVRRRGGVARRILVLNRRGDVLGDLDAHGREWEVVGVHRADLHEILAREAGELRLASRCTGFVEGDRTVAAQLDDRSEVEGDILVGADGIRSTIRAQLKGVEPLRFAGYFGWRAAIEFDDPALAERFSESWGPRFRVGLITIGGGRLYWFVSERAPEAEPLPADPRAYFREQLRDWHEPIQAVIEATPDGALSRLPIHDRLPVRSWGRGRVTLLGDAAHPMTPNLGQGGAQALEDAVVLAEAVRESDDITAALREYERRRIPRTTLIVKRSRQLGRIAQLASPAGCAVRDLVMKATPAGVQRRQQELVIRPGF